MDELSGKVAVITGGASGIGLALARRLAAESMSLVIADIEQSALDAAVSALSETTEVIGVRADVSKYDEVESIATAAVERFGAIHLAVNNAGVALGGQMWDLTIEDWQWVLGVDLWGVIHGMKAFVPRLIASGGGHIVNTASMAGLTSLPFMGPYNVSKHGVVTLSETLYAELALLHPEVGVTVVCPGWVRTGINRSERNRAATGNAGEAVATVPKGEDGIGSIVDGLIAGGIDPDEVATLIVAAVKAGDLYVLTHPDWTPMVTRRADGIVAGINPEVTIPGL